MQRLWVPPRVSRELQDQTRQYAHEIASTSRVDETCRRFNKDLRDMDPYLEMVFFPEGLPLPAGAVPGRYHLTYRAPAAPATLISLTGPNGEFIEPTSGVFKKLAQGDMWSNVNRKERDRRARVAERAAERAKRREDEDRLEELKDRFNAAFRTSVSMNRDSRWSQNASGARGRKAA